MTVADSENKLEDAILAEAGWIRHLARSLVRDEGAAADLAQDVLAAAIEKRPHLPARLRGWLRGVTVRLAARRHRERQAREKREAAAARPLASNQDEDAVERLRVHRRLTDAVLSLPEPYRSVVIARFFDGLAPREIARRRELSPEVIRQQIHRALTMLRLRLDKEFGDRRAWGAALVSLLEDPLTPAVPVLVGAFAVKKILAAAIAVVLLLVGYRVLMPQTSLPVPASSEQVQATGVIPSAAAADAVQPHRVALEDETAGRILSLEVLDAGGASVPGASLWIWNEKSEIRRGTSDSEGRASLPGEAEPGHLFVWAEGSVPVAQELDELQGRYQIILQPGEELAGWVRVDGQDPMRPISLEIDSSQMKILPEGLPEAVVEELRGLGVGDPGPFKTDAHGSFRVQGLPLGWSGAIRVPLSEPYWIRQVTKRPGSSRSRSLARSQTGLELDLTELPVLEGLVVWADTLEPIGLPDLRLTFSATVLGGTYSDMSDGFRIEPDGSFRHGIQILNGVDPMVWMDPERRPPVEKIRIEANIKGAANDVFVELDVSELTPPYQAGTIRIPRAQLRHVIVRDLDGRPVPGAIVQAQSLSQPTDAEGRTTVRRSSGAFRVGAIGSRIGILEPASGSGSLADPLVFVLEPGNVLVLRLLDDAGEVSPVKELSLSWEGYLFAGEEARYGLPSGVHKSFSDSFRFRHGPNFRDGVPVPGSEGTGTITLDAEGRAVIVGLTPQARLTTRIQGALGDLAFEQAVIGPGLDERKQVDLVFSAKPFVVRGRVLDEDDRPIHGASVSGNLSHHARTGRDGAFIFEPVYVQQESSIAVRHRGHVPVMLDGVVLGPETGPLEIRMQAGHDVRVTAVDATGAAVPVGFIDYEDRMKDWSLRENQGRLEPGAFLFEDMPKGRTVFWCEVLGKRYDVTHEVGSGGDDVRIQVPEMGELLVTVPGNPSELAKDSLYLHVNVASLRDPDLELEEMFWARAPRFLLPPGQYRIRLDEVRRQGQQELGRRTIQGPIEVTVRARELVTHEMR